MKKEYSHHLLLVDTKSELNYIVSCILQSSHKEASQFSNMVGKAIISKISSAGATTGIMSLVATYGTASTGTAIAGLHGAAAYSATIGWIGGIVGSILTGGLALAVGVGTYKLLSSQARDYSSINERERYFVDCCIILIRYIDEWLGKDEIIKTEELKRFSQNDLTPLINEINSELDDLLKHLDIKNSIFLKAQITQTFQRYLEKYEKLEDKKEGK